MNPEDEKEIYIQDPVAIADLQKRVKQLESRLSYLTAQINGGGPAMNFSDIRGRLSHNQLPLTPPAKWGGGL